jgi:hypothetical protein
MVTSPGIRSIDEDTFLGASNLQFLYIPGNRIKKLQKEAFRGATNLNEINLSDNQIEVIHEEAFNGLDHLESLNLSRNQIAFFGQETLKPLSELMNLDISENQIEFLDARLFINNEKLNGINIQNNQLLSITNGFLQLLPQIKVLNVINNPCTNNTMLDNYPLVKIVDSKKQNSGDENSLERCYQNYIDMADPESTDLNDLLSQAEIVRDDIEESIIADLNEELHERDITIRELQRRDELLIIVILIMFSIVSFFGVIRLIMYVVNTTFQRELQQKFSNNNIKVEMIDPKQVVYTIEVD